MRTDSRLALIVALLCALAGCASRPLASSSQPLQEAPLRAGAQGAVAGAPLENATAVKAQTAPADAATGGDRGGSGSPAPAAAKVPLPNGATAAMARRRAIAPSGTRSARISGGGYSGGNGAAAREVGDGSDDDIIALRLRKVAENETDPDLKGKLWKEYVDYRNGTQR